MATTKPSLRSRIGGYAKSAGSWMTAKRKAALKKAQDISARRRKSKTTKAAANNRIGSVTKRSKIGEVAFNLKSKLGRGKNAVKNKAIAMAKRAGTAIDNKASAASKAIGKQVDKAKKTKAGKTVIAAVGKVKSATKKYSRKARVGKLQARNKILRKSSQAKSAIQKRMSKKKAN